MKSTLFIAASLLLFVGAGKAQLAPNAPTDKAHSIDQQRAAAYEAAIAPHVAEARQTYASAKARFLIGLPKGQAFYVTTRLKDSLGRFEQVFIRVYEIKDATVSGMIASQVHLIPGYREGQRYSFPEAALIDWLIAKPDGSEEGNFVGKFLDTYRQ
jgi:Uncharacterized protein conserved in bacteria (DUF2314)